MHGSSAGEGRLGMKPDARSTVLEAHNAKDLKLSELAREKQQLASTLPFTAAGMLPKAAESPRT